MAGHRQNVDPGVAGCHLQPPRGAKLPYWPFTTPANWVHASSAVHDVLARLGRSYDGAMDEHHNAAGSLSSKGLGFVKKFTL